MGRTFVTFQEAAEILKCSKRTIHNHIKRGRLRRTYENDSVVLHREEVEQLAEEHGAKLPALNNKTLLECLSRIRDLEVKVAVFQKLTGIDQAPPLRPSLEEAKKLVDNVLYYLERTSFTGNEIDFWTNILTRIDESTLDLVRKHTGRIDFWHDLFSICLKLTEFVATTRTLSPPDVYRHRIELTDAKKRLREVCLLWVELRGTVPASVRKHLGIGRDDLIKRLIP